MILTPEDQQFLWLSLRENRGYRAACQWYFDWDPMPLQYAMHQAQQLNVTLKTGVGYGKTMGDTFSSMLDCMAIPYFSALNTSVTAAQAELGFTETIEPRLEGKHLAHLIADVKLRPWPTIHFQNYSTFEFRTAGMNGRFLRGHTWDRACYDEAELDYIGETVKVLRGRMRGERPNGTPRMARIDCLGTPSDSPWWIDRFNLGWRSSGKENLSQYLSLRATTYDNTHITPEQIAAMEAEYTDEDRRVEMMAEDPDYGRSMFPRTHIRECTSQAINDLVAVSLNPRLADESDHGPSKKGYVVEEHPRHGVVKMELPYDPRGLYIMAGDPGTDDPPKRNAGCIIAFRIDKEPASLSYFHWVSGQGSYLPFLSSYKHAITKYRPQLKLLDTTGPQRAMQELAFEQQDIQTDGMNFSKDKEAALNALSMAVSNHELQWPVIKGLLKQISTYSRDADKDKAFPQDIVMTLAMCAWAMRFASSEVGEGVPVVPVHRSRAYRTTRRKRR